MEIHSHGLDTLGVNKEAEKVYNPEIKDILAPTSSQIPAGENFGVHSSVDTAGVQVNDEPSKNVGIDSNTTLNYALSFPPATSNFNTSPHMYFQPFDSVETGQDPQPELNQVPEQDGGFDDMVILDNDVVKSATVDEGAGHTLDGFQIMDIQTEELHDSPVPDIYNASSVAADGAVTEENVKATMLDILGAVPAEVTAILTADVTVVTTVIHEVTVTEPKEAATVEAATKLPISVEKESPPVPTSEIVEANVPDATEDTVMGNIAADGDTAQKTEPSVGTLHDVSDEDILAIKGQKVVKKFGIITHFGKVVDFDPETKWFKVVYEDGDSEELELSEVKKILGSTKKKGSSLLERDSDTEFSGRNAKKPRKTGSASTVKKSRRVSNSAVKSPKTPGSKAKVQKSSRDTSASKKVKSPRKSMKRALNSSAVKTPANSEVKEEKKRKAGTVTPKGIKGASSKKQYTKASRSLNLESPESHRRVKGKTSAESSSSKLGKISGSKRKVNNGESNTERSKRSRKAVSDTGGDTNLVGKKVRKDFGGSLYNGAVLNFDKKTQFYKVKYTDGDQEDLELHELEPILVEALRNTDEKDDRPAKSSPLSSPMSVGTVSGTRKRK